MEKDSPQTENPSKANIESAPTFGIDFNPQMTTNWGHPVDDNQNSMTVGERGPQLLQDLNFIEKHQSFNRERIPERVVHARGTGVHGYFEVTDDITA